MPLDTICNLHYPHKQGPLVAAQIVTDDTAPRVYKPHLPFSHGPEQLLMFFVHYEAEEMTIFIPSSTILDCIKKATEHRKVFSWEEWGPRGSFLVQSDFLHFDICGTSVLRRELLSDAPTKTTTVAFYDFGQRAYRKHVSDASGSPHGETETTGLVKESVYGKSAVFRSQEIKTSLPARLRHHTLELDHDLSTISEMRIGEDALMYTHDLGLTDECHIMTF
ncbi:hypothetical protein EUX98_g6967 [Antrodiella citrinella]|uniref:Uncharacterized protein n=1 Tax=Antrodiella citrinella TaxID=2447956 RepID=A0A4S4MPQ0_9APHY|nr:hypothetical protein EUX98_g6967 [Antrodiella citrinella]